MKKFIATLATALLALSACQSTEGLPALKINDRSAAVSVLQKVNNAAQACWVKSKDADFRPYRVIPELDTRAGKPRILIVEAKAAQGLPKLVIEAEGKPARIAAYGPLAQSPLAGRIKADVDRWAAGSSACKA
jgi:hypothetical protein